MGLLHEIAYSMASKAGFEAGVNGQAPQTFFCSGSNSEVARRYRQGYERGMEAAKIRLQASAAKGIIRLTGGE